MATSSDGAISRVMSGAPPRFLVYALVDPRTRQWRYVGKSTFGIKRPQRHWRTADTEDTHKGRWIRQLKRLGLKYEILILETFENDSRVSDAEREWILAARTMGVPLTNASDGGDGRGLGYVTSPESKAKIGASNRVSKATTSYKDLQSEINRTTWADAGVRERRQAGIKAFWSIPANRERMLASRKSKKGVPVAPKIQRPFVDQNGVRYESQGEAARRLGVDQPAVGQVLRGRYTNTKGYVFRYVEDSE